VRAENHLGEDIGATVYEIKHRKLVENGDLNSAEYLQAFKRREKPFIVTVCQLQFGRRRTKRE
jgi:hypothetical protein